ncbi:hypothetical protein SFUMM280S_07980 [Streptomyces fumanus]
MAPTVTPAKRTRPGYGQLLRTRGAWTFLLPGFAARQPFAMLTISIVLLVQHTTGSYGAAGAAAAVTGVSMAVFAPTAAGSPTATGSVPCSSPASWRTSCPGWR